MSGLTFEKRVDTSSKEFGDISRLRASGLTFIVLLVHFSFTTPAAERLAGISGFAFSLTMQLPIEFANAVESIV